jgi:hypothetical protein
MPESRRALQGDLLHAILQWPEKPWSPGQFQDLALRLFAWQMREIPAYGLWASRRLNGQMPSDSRSFPLAPVAAFKAAPLATPAALEHPVARFETSGTSDGQPGQVVLRDTALYDAGLQQAFGYWLAPDRLGQNGRQFRCLSLVPTRHARPHSSLGFMVRRLAQRWDDGGGSEHLGLPGDADALDIQGFIAACDRARADNIAVLIFATTVALHLLLENLPANWSCQLPYGSRLMDTGGPKGRHTVVARPEQHRILAERLGLDPLLIAGELGMTELCGQRYEATARQRLLGLPVTPRRYHAPPWLAARITRVEDGALCQPGEVGLVGHLDLSNLDTCAFIQTADLGEIAEDGSLVLHGRLPGSAWRGCGLDAEELTGLR